MPSSDRPTTGRSHRCLLRRFPNEPKACRVHDGSMKHVTRFPLRRCRDTLGGGCGTNGGHNKTNKDGAGREQTGNSAMNEGMVRFRSEQRATTKGLPVYQFSCARGQIVCGHGAGTSTP
mmetsp:Transcript_10263/g.24922  ORF Transcript_10263/g.24922 Transcript_10263/m.24922 type:complete len:119 (+) Transcript_10263:133-489(+)